MIGRRELLEAHRDGGGYCLFCAFPHENLASPYASECEQCGHIAVLPAAMILTFLAWILNEEDE